MRRVTRHEWSKVLRCPRRAAGLLRLGGCAAIFAFLSGLLSGCAYVNGNFREVERGAYYRSGQLDAALLDLRIRNHGIRTVVNLDGARRTGKRNVLASALCEEHGVAHYTLEWSMQRPPDPESLQLFVTILREAERPVLVHCHGGVHRAAIAAACYRLMQGESVDAARGELGLFFNNAPIGQLIELYAESGTPFNQWAFEYYPAQYDALGLEDANARTTRPNLRASRSVE